MAAQLLARDKAREWRVMAQNADGYFLATTVNPLFMLLSSPNDDWFTSEVRDQLNTSFLNSLPHELIQRLRNIAYPHDSRQRNSYPVDNEPAPKHDQETTIAYDKVIILSYEEQERIDSGLLTESVEYHSDWCGGLSFRFEGMRLETRLGILKWARELNDSGRWCERMVYRDQLCPLTDYHPGYTYIPNSIFPVICLDVRANRDKAERPIMVGIESFWGETVQSREGEDYETPPYQLPSSTRPSYTLVDIDDEDVPF